MSAPESSWLDDADQATEQVAAFRAAAQRRHDAAARATDRLRRISVEAWSPRREVRVVLDAAGLVSDVEFAESAPQGSLASLARAVLRAHDDAVRRYQAEVERIAQEEYAQDPELRAATVAAARASVPAPTDDA